MAVSKQTTIETVSTIVEFLQWVENLQGDKLLYRGLANQTWQVQSSASRRLDKSANILQLQSYINQLLDNVRLQGFDQKEGRTISDLELLAELQHHGAATCLIDFTTNPLTALWFACHESLDGESGKVVAMRTDNTTTFSEVTSKTLKNEITTFLSPDKIWKWTPPSTQNSHIVAQNSSFTFGPIEIKAEHYEQIVIAKSDKKEIRHNLERLYGITENSLFCDFTGFSMANMHTKEFTNYSAEDCFDLGITYQQRDDYQKAIDYYNQAIKINPQYADAYNNRGVVKADLGDPQGAIDDYNKAIKINPQLAEAYNNRGNAKAKLGDLQGAIADFTQAIAINPQYTEAYNNRGASKADLGDQQGAIADYDKAIKINPQYADAYNNRGVVKADLGDPQRAIDDYNKAIKINPQNAEAYYNHSVVKADLGDHQGAISGYDKAIEIKPQYADAYNNRGVVKAKLGDLQEAIDDYNQAIVINPQYAKAYNNRGNAKAKLGDHQGAINDYDKALAINPQYVGARKNLNLVKKTLKDGGKNETNTDK